MMTLTNPLMHFQVINYYHQALKIIHKLSDSVLLTVCGVLLVHDKLEGFADFWLG